LRNVDATVRRFGVLCGLAQKGEVSADRCDDLPDAFASVSNDGTTNPVTHA